jgi:hypothetical protein
MLRKQTKDRIGRVRSKLETIEAILGNNFVDLEDPEEEIDD